MKVSILTSIVFFAALIQSCNEAGFDSATVKAKKVNNDSLLGKQPQDPFGNDPFGSPSNGGDAQAGGQISQREAECLLKRADSYRIVIVIDQSGSTTQTDPGNIRGNSAQRLADKFTDFVVANPRANVTFASIGFAGSASVGPNRWVALSQNSRSQVMADIAGSANIPRTIGGKNRGGGTNFTVALNTISQVLAEGSYSNTSSQTRTYVILLSDGEANGAQDRDRNSLINLAQGIVSGHGAAFYSILLGSGKGGSLMQSLALPVTSFDGSDHRGSFFHAPNISTVEQAFANFFSQLTSC